MAVRTKVEQLQLAGRGWLVLKPSPHRHLGVTSVDILDFGDTFCSDVITLHCFNESVGCESGIRTLTAAAACLLSVRFMRHRLHLLTPQTFVSEHPDCLYAIKVSPLCR